MRLLMRFLIVCFSCTLFLPACGVKSTPSYYINQDTDFSFIKTVAVLPLDNLTNDRFAGESVRQVVISELLASGQVCPPRQSPKGVSDRNTLLLSSTLTG